MPTFIQKIVRLQAALYQRRGRGRCCAVCARGRRPPAGPNAAPPLGRCCCQAGLCASSGSIVPHQDRILIVWCLCVYIIHIIIDLTATAVKFFSDYSSDKIVLFICFKSGRNFLISKFICLEDSKIFFLIDLTVWTACFYREIERIVRAL